MPKCNLRGRHRRRLLKSEDVISPKTRVGIIVFALGTVVLGAVGLAWGDFASNWQPLEAFGNVPNRKGLAYCAAAALVLGGAGLLSRRTLKPAATLLLLPYGAFAVFWLPRVIGFPKIFGTWGGFFQELAFVVPLLILLLPNRLRVAQLLFGICVLSFGVEHFTALAQTAALVPAWIPPNQTFWAVATGIFFTLAGIALVTTICDLLAARLLTAMLLGFGALVWAPFLFAYPHSHNVWAGNAVNLVAAGSAWVVAGAIAQTAAGGK